MESGILYHLETASLPVFDDAVAFACVVQTAENQVDTEVGVAVAVVAALGLVTAAESSDRAVAVAPPAVVVAGEKGRQAVAVD